VNDLLNVHAQYSTVSVKRAFGAAVMPDCSDNDGRLASNVEGGCSCT